MFQSSFVAGACLPAGLLAADVEVLGAVGEAEVEACRQRDGVKKDGEVVVGVLDCLSGNATVVFRGDLRVDWGDCWRAREDMLRRKDEATKEEELTVEETMAWMPRLGSATGRSPSWTVAPNMAPKADGPRRRDRWKDCTSANLHGLNNTMKLLS